MKNILLISIGLLLFSFFPFFLLKQDSHILIHDNLDSEFIYLHILKISGNLFSYNNSDLLLNIFNGLNTFYIHSEFSLIRILFYLFPSFWAYILNSLLIRTIGIVGICLLVRDFGKSIEIPNYLLIVVAVSYALLPVYSLYGISIMGQPILLWSFLNLKNRKRHFISYFVIFLFPFYSHFAMTAPFILITLLVYGVYVIIKKRTNSSSFIIGVGALFISYIIANFITIENFLQNNAQTHRDLWKNNYPDIESTIRLIAETILNGQYHAASIFGLPILIIALYSIFKKTSKWKTIFHFIISIVLIAFYYSTYRYITVFFEDSLHLLTTFNFNRFTFFVPFIFYLLLLTFYSDKKINRVLLYSLTWVFCLGNIYFNSELKYSTAKLILPNQSTQLLPSYNSFFSPALFNEITAFIALPQEDYRVVSLGIHPSIAQYNGFYTLDSYQNIYPLEYKFKFRKIIQPELNKNNVLKEYFDNWGSRVYLFSSELQESCYVDCPKYFSETIQELNVDVISLKQMSCKYIFSSVKIINAEQIGLELENMFEDDQSFYQIFLYKI